MNYFSCQQLTLGSYCLGKFGSVACVRGPLPVGLVGMLSDSFQLQEFLINQKHSRDASDVNKQRKQPASDLMESIPRMSHSGGPRGVSAWLPVPLRSLGGGKTPEECS